MRACAAALLICAVAAARADEPQEENEKAAATEARMYFDAGRQAYEAGDYLTAIRSFELAYAASPRPPIAFSLAQAYRKQFIVDNDPSRLKLAVKLYRQYLDDVPQGGRREDAVTYLGELQPQLLRLEAVQPVSTAPAVPAPSTQLMVTSRAPDARAAIDGEALARVPLTRDIKPGVHPIRVEAPGYFGEELTGLAVEGRLVVVEAALREMPARLVIAGAAGADAALDGRSISVGSGAIDVPAGRHLLTVTRRGHEPLARQLTLIRGGSSVVDAELSTTTQRKLSYVILGVAGLSLAGAGVTTTLAFAAERDAKDLLDKQRRVGLTAEELDDYRSRRQRRDDLVLVSVILYGGAALTGVTGLLLYFADSPRPPAAPLEREPSRLVPQIGPGEIGASYVGRF